MPPLATKPSAPETLTGPQKAAVFCMALGKEQAAKVMQLLPPAAVEIVGREIAELPNVPPHLVDGVLEEYRELARAVTSVAHGGLDSAREILEEALGPARAKEVLERIKSQLSDAGLKRLKKATPDILLSILRGEHPQTIALILAHLESKLSAAIIEQLEPELAADVLYRVARMDKVSPEMVHLVESQLASKADLSLTTEMTLSGGPLAVANVLNIAGPTMEKQLLESIGRRDAKLVEAIKGLMFVFEDLITLDKKAMQRLLRDVDGRELAMALKVASEELKRHIFENMSERASEALREEMDMLGPVKVKDVEAAHGRIIGMVRSLEEAGEIQLSGRGGDTDVVV
ncbi:MAG: flagellar motor switch protein FliG [Gemmatimonadales bacterium]|nr:flagellar motor switch protein FliG [Gemmatimonadales bacterium]